MIVRNYYIYTYLQEKRREPKFKCKTKYLVPASKKDLHLESNSAYRKEKVISTVNPSASKEMNHCEDEDENGYVLIDDYVRRFPPPRNKQGKEESVTKPCNISATDGCPLPSDTDYESDFQMLPEIKRLTRARQTKLNSPGSMSPHLATSNGDHSVDSRRPFVTRTTLANAANVEEYENSIINGVGITSLQSHPGYPAPSERDNDIVYVLPEDAAYPNDPIVGEYSNQEGWCHPPIEGQPGMYDDIIPTTPVKLGHLNESAFHVDQDVNHHGVEFVTTQENPAYAVIPHVYDGTRHMTPDNQVYINNSMVDHEGHCSGHNGVEVQANPAYAATPQMYEDFIHTAPKTPDYINESTLGAKSYCDGRSVGVNRIHHSAYATKQTQ